MSQNPGQLSVGNVVSASLRLYRDNFKTYFGVSLIACLWVLAPFLALVIIGAILAAILVPVITAGNEGIALVFLLIFLLFWLVLLIYCVAKSLTNAAVISRLVFGLLNNKPETVTEVRKQIKSKTWIFWLTQFVLGIWLTIVCFPAALLRQVVPFLGNQNSAMVALLTMLTELLYWLVYLWFYSRYFFPELPLAIENDITGPIQAIGRTWNLTKGFAWRIVLIITVAFIITIPVYLIAGIPVIIAFVSAVASATAYGGFSLEAAGAIISAFLFSIILFILLNIIALPFWQAVKAVIYYDLRSRREGLGLDLRDSFSSN